MQASDIVAAVQRIGAEEGRVCQAARVMIPLEGFARLRCGEDFLR